MLSALNPTFAVRGKDLGPRVEDSTIVEDLTCLRPQQAPTSHSQYTLETWFKHVKTPLQAVIFLWLHTSERPKSRRA